MREENAAPAKEPRLAWPLAVKAVVEAYGNTEARVVEVATT